MRKKENSLLHSVHFYFYFKKSKKGRAPWTVQGEKRSPFVFVKRGLHDRAPTGSWAPNGTVSFFALFSSSHLVVPANVGLVVWSRVGSKWLDWNDDTCLSISVMWGPFLSQLTRGSFFYIYIYTHTGPLRSDQSDDGICFVTHNRKWNNMLVVSRWLVLYFAGWNFECRVVVDGVKSVFVLCL